MNLTHTGRTALVTGATRLIGIGAATCLELARSGANVVFTHWTSYDSDQYGTPASDPEELLARLREFPVKSASIECDLASPGSAPALFDAAEAAIGNIDILINNAAHSTHDNVDTLTSESLDQHYRVNSRATAMLTVEFARRFRGTHGRVVNFSSGQHLGSMPDELAYAMSKGAIVAFSQSIAPDLAKRGITINVINPGATDTGWISPEFHAELVAAHPMGRVGTPEDAARAIAWLTSEEAAWISGQVINSEGMYRGG